jgi:hypothetical protein
MSGIIPPIRPGLPGHDPDRSPYRAELHEFIAQFVLSADRAKVLQGFLDYRAALHDHRIVKGFQWLNGSFLEHIEDIETRPPRDIDVVTFFYLPSGQTQVSLLPTIQSLIDPNASKAAYSVDGYAMVLGDDPMSEAMIRQTCYWYSMWSHRRDGIWKGFVQVDLDPARDPACKTLLQEKIAGGLL